MEDKTQLDVVENGVIIDNFVSKGIEIGSNPNCITGDNNHLLDNLKKGLQKAVRVDIIVAFLMETGVRLIEKDLYF